MKDTGRRHWVWPPPGREGKEVLVEAPGLEVSGAGELRRPGWTSVTLLIQLELEDTRYGGT